MLQNIKAWGVSLQGKSHIERGVVCQDAHCYDILPNGWMMGVVADGVGSASRAEIGSRTASQSVLEYCQSNIKSGDDAQKVLEILSEAYEFAMCSVAAVCRKEKGRLPDYDTTLTVAVYNGNQLVYGHEGDGGILIRTSLGQIREITNRHKGMDGVSVCPLRSGRSSWEFAICDEEVDSVLLVTDGMLEALTPGLLQVVEREEVSENISIKRKKPLIYRTMAEFLMNPYVSFLSMDKNEGKGTENIRITFLRGEMDSKIFGKYLELAYKKMFSQKQCRQIMQSVKEANYSTWAIKQVVDDITVVGMYREKKKYSASNLDCYIEPQWGDLHLQLEKSLYPGIVGKEKENQNQSDKQIDSHAIILLLKGIKRKADRVRKNLSIIFR